MCVCVCVCDIPTYLCTVYPCDCPMTLVCMYVHTYMLYICTYVRMCPVQCLYTVCVMTVCASRSTPYFTDVHTYVLNVLYLFCIHVCMYTCLQWNLDSTVGTYVRTCFNTVKPL